MGLRAFHPWALKCLFCKLLYFLENNCEEETCFTIKNHADSKLCMEIDFKDGKGKEEKCLDRVDDHGVADCVYYYENQEEKVTIAASSMDCPKKSSDILV